MHGQNSLILLCRTKVSEIFHWFIHQALTPPHLCNPAYYQRSSVTRKITLLKIHDKVNCIVGYILQCGWNALQTPFEGTIRKRSQITYKKPKKYVEEYNSSRLSHNQPAHISGNQHRSRHPSRLLKECSPYAFS